MLIDLSLRITKELYETTLIIEKPSSFGHMGTHFDVMDKEFPLEFTKRNAVILDVSNVKDRDIDISDIDLDLVKKDMFVIFYSGFMEKEKYGTAPYFSGHPQLSNELIDALLDKKVSLVGVDFAGIRRGAEHTPKDQYCADRGVFIIENLTNLDKVLGKKPFANFTAHVYPVNFADMPGLPCRVVAEV